MSTRQQILRAHYVRLARKVAAWVGVLSLIAATLTASTATAAVGQLTSRKGTLSTSAANASGVTTTFLFNPSVLNSGATIKGVKFELCDSPLEAVTCVSPTAATLASATAGVQSSTGTYTNQLGTPAYTSTTAVTFKHATGNTLNSADVITFPVASIHLPSTANLSFYYRITTYNSDTVFNGSTEVDFGAVAESTTQTIDVSANVQESLVFCTGTNTPADCTSMTGSAVKIGQNPSTDNVLLLGTATGNTSSMYITTNAASGYAITYSAGEFSSDGGTTNIAKASNNTLAACASGSTNGDCFGINVRDNATPNVGTDVTGTSGFVSPTLATGYGTADTFKFVSGAAQQVASTATPTVQTQYTVTYAARAGTTTKPGAYSTTFTWIATGTF